MNPRAIETLALEVQRAAEVRTQAVAQMVGALRECEFFVKAMTEHGANHPDIPNAEASMVYLSGLLDQIKGAIDLAEYTKL